jgi:hypothetical protein
MVATASSGGGICLRTTATGETTILNYNGGLVMDLAFSSDGSTLVSLEENVLFSCIARMSRILSWDVGSKRYLRTYRCNEKGWAPSKLRVQGSKFVWVIEEKKYPKAVRISRLQLETGVFTYSFPSSEHFMGGVSFSPDAAAFAT